MTKFNNVFGMTTVSVVSNTPCLHYQGFEITALMIGKDSVPENLMWLPVGGLLNKVQTGLLRNNDLISGEVGTFRHNVQTNTES